MKKFTPILLILTLLLVLVGCRRGEEPSQTDCTHQDTEWVTLAEPSCMEQGQRQLRCSDCQQTLGEPEVVVPTGHTFVNDKCEYCASMNIRDAEGLRRFSQTVESGQSFEGAEVNLLSDIDLNDTTWIPVGAIYDQHFAGRFNGNGHKIANFKISPMDSECRGNGFFLKNLGTICDLTLENVSLTYVDESLSEAGLLAGINGGAIENCHVSGTVTVSISMDWCSAGGLVGINGGTVEGCSAAVDMNVRSQKLEKNLMSGCIVGGLAGKNLEKSLIANSYATGNVLADGWGGARAGGLVGGNTGAVTHCYATGNVSAATTAPIDTHSVAGGLLGNSSIATDSAAKVTGCFATGRTTATGGASACAGTLVGLVPTNEEQIVDCYRLDTAQVTADTVCDLGETVTEEELQTAAFVKDTLGWDPVLWVVPAKGYAIFQK